jgi:putative transposase
MSKSSSYSHWRGTLRRARPLGGRLAWWTNETLNPRERPPKGRARRSVPLQRPRRLTRQLRQRLLLRNSMDTPGNANAPVSEPGGGQASLPYRRNPAHPHVHENLDEPTIVFLTVCTAARQPILACQDVAELLLTCWSDKPAWIVGRYVIMPDHVHLFCAPAAFPGRPLIQWVRYWKSCAARAWPRPGEQPVWQRDCWDTQLRRGDSYAAKWEYVLANPVRAGLARHAADWPYQGELNALRW